MSASMGAPWDQAVSAKRTEIKKVAASVKEMAKEAKEFPKGSWPEAADSSEIIANIVLAYRHLEDAAMRLGKVLQAYDGGVSVYDK